MKINLSRRSLIWLSLATISLLAGILFSYQYIQTRNNFYEIAKQNSVIETHNAAKKMGDLISALKKTANDIANTLSDTKLTKEKVETILTEKSLPFIFGIGAAFIPYAVDPQTKFYAPYFFENQGVKQLNSLETSYSDYTQDPWFKEFITAKEGGFTDSHSTALSNTIIADYITPIQTTGGDTIGVVYVSQSVEHLKYILDSFFLGQNGYGSLMTNDGTFLVHPEEEVIQKKTTIYDIAKKINDPQLAEAGKKMITGEKVFLEYNNSVTGNPSWLFSEPIPGTDWSVIGSFDKNEIEIDRPLLRRLFINPSFCFTLFFIFLLFFLLSLSTAITTDHWWLVSISIALALLCNILWIWYAIYSYPEKKDHFDAVENKRQLHSYIESAINASNTSHSKSLNTPEQTDEESSESYDVLVGGYKNEKLIPTGIYINSIQFLSSQKIQLSAFVWQRYTKGLHDEIPRGFLLPQATEIITNEVSRTTNKETEVIMWSVQAELNQEFTFRQYPFDIKEVHIIMWHQYSKKLIALIPDLDAYQLIHPSALPGMDIDIMLPGWNLLKSNFDYQKTNYGSNFGSYSIGSFGIYESIDKSHIPELNFSITLQRQLINTLVSDLLPLAILALLLFAILFSSFSNASIVGWIASVFFSSLFSQLRLRESILSNQIVYMEAFYFIIYFLILLLLIIVISTHVKERPQWVIYKKKSIPQLVYWPLLLSSCLAVTIWYLY